MTNFNKITSDAKYPIHVIKKAAQKMLLNAAYELKNVDEQSAGIIRSIVPSVNGREK
jgi:hypothetical protein